jgi:hypothetical protein
MNQKLKNIKQLLLVSTALLITTSITSCKKFLDVKAPSTSINEDNVYTTEATAIAALTEIYSQMVMIGYGEFSGESGNSVLSGLSADELALAGSVSDETLIAYYKNHLRTGPGLGANYGTNYWATGFLRIFQCNAAIEGLNKSASLTTAVKMQLLGEAKFMRALVYFYLANYYGDVPLVLTTDPNVNRTLPRSPQKQVYEQIIVDLKDAQSHLSNSFLDATLVKTTAERVRPTRWAATALLARVYLYLGQYTDAETEATKIISNSSQFSLAQINSVFLRNSSEAIWQMQPVNRGRNTEDAFTFILPPTGPNINNNPVYLSTRLLNAFEPGDARRQTGGWVDSIISGGTTYFFPAKYRATITSGSVTEYLMVLRLAEQYLIRSEARAHLNNFHGAKDDLNEIRTRANLPATSANDQASLLAAIQKERQVELFTELGQRWLDLKRTGTVDDVMNEVTPLKANGDVWNSYQQLYPIPYSDIQKNPNLIQNPGY